MGILSFITTSKYWLIALVVASALGFGGGFYEGTSHIAKINASELASAASKAAAAQANKDARDFAATKADFEKRRVANTKSEVKYQTIYRDRKVLVPNTAKVTISATAMKALNDPELIGGDGQ